jgi:hypothetical protein
MLRSPRVCTRWARRIVEHPVGVSDPGQVIGAGELEVLRGRDLPGDPATLPRWLRRDRLLGRLQDRPDVIHPLLETGKVVSTGGP